MSKPAPYPADTKAKGWRFELDLEQVRQSDTWALANAATRPWLLMLWATAWEQVPCGSLPADDALIAARMGMDLKAFTKVRTVLLRGWWVADDGRLYQDTIVTRVLAMLDKRTKDAQRTANSRAKRAGSHAAHTSVTRDTQVTNEQATGEFDTKHQAPDTSNTPPTTARAPAIDNEVLPITAEWLPGPGFTAQAKLAGLPVLDAAAMAEGLNEFRGYWLARPNELRTQAEWDNTLAKSLKTRQVMAASRPQPQAAQRRAGSHSGFQAKDYTAGVNADGSLA